MRYWLDRLVSDQVLEAAVVYGYFPCYSEGNTSSCWTRTPPPSGPGSPSRAAHRTPAVHRRLLPAPLVGPARCDRDAAGHRRPAVSEYADKLRAAHAYRDYFEVHGLSVQLAEALAEYWHQRIRSELVLPSGPSLADFDPPNLAGILATDYRGCRYSFGYAACPDLEDRAKIAAILDPERIGVVLSEEFQLDPEQSTDAIVVHHPEAATSTPSSAHGRSDLRKRGSGRPPGHHQAVILFLHVFLSCW
jgi:5-methyltetrahydrofolate--homocysteine methyltransferase